MSACPTLSTGPGRSGTPSKPVLMGGNTRCFLLALVPRAAGLAGRQGSHQAGQDRIQSLGTAQLPLSPPPPPPHLAKGPGGGKTSEPRGEGCSHPLPHALLSTPISVPSVAPIKGPSNTKPFPQAQLAVFLLLLTWLWEHSDFGGGAGCRAAMAH